MSSILKYLPTKEETKPVQVNVPLSLRNSVDVAREEDGLTLHEIVIAGLRMYIDERSAKKPRRKES